MWTKVKSLFSLCQRYGIRRCNCGPSNDPTDWQPSAAPQNSPEVQLQRLLALEVLVAADFPTEEAPGEVRPSRVGHLAEVSEEGGDGGEGEAAEVAAEKTALETGLVIRQQESVRRVCGEEKEMSERSSCSPCGRCWLGPVSYTHLTLPTILLV